MPHIPSWKKALPSGVTNTSAGRCAARAVGSGNLAHVEIARPLQAELLAGARQPAVGIGGRRLECGEPLPLLRGVAGEFLVGSHLRREIGFDPLAETIDDRPGLPRCPGPAELDGELRAAVTFGYGAGEPPVVNAPVPLAIVLELLERIGRNDDGETGAGRVNDLEPVGVALVEEGFGRLFGGEGLRGAPPMA